MVDVADLSLFLATAAQVQASRTKNYAHWGRGLALENYLKRTELLDVYEHAADGNLTTWVLAPRDDPQTLDFVAACETFRREVLVLEASSNDPEETFAYGIAAVFCPPQHRRRGYAQHMMRLLHRVLAVPGSLSPFPPEWGSPPTIPPGHGNARFSALWSDVGVAYYETCGPTLSHVGWKVKDPIATIWTTDANAQHRGEVRWLSEQNCLELWKQDAQYVKERLIDRPLGSLPPKTRCTFFPHRGLAAFLLRRAKFFLPGVPSIPVPTKWGVVIPGTTPPAYATWITDIRPLPVALLVTRVRASAETLPLLLSAMMEAAKENEAATIEVWNLDRDLLAIASLLGGITSPRNEHLPALAWYGPEDSDDVDWLFNEKFCWC